MVLLAIMSLVGCNPRTVVTRNPASHVKGVRYYRPKPYLVVLPLTPMAEKKGTVVTLKPPSDKFVTIELKWLPDFSEEYALDVRSGLGTAEVNFTLKDGWMLTSITQNLDSQFNENVDAVAKLLGAVAPTGIVGAPQMETMSPPLRTAKAQVRATNVPIGYYEAILGTDNCGRKQIYGWRYLGFAPYESCALAPTGLARTPCNQLDLYGLVFDEKGTMTFKQLRTIKPSDVVEGAEFFDDASDSIGPSENTTHADQSVGNDIVETHTTSSSVKRAKGIASFAR